VGYPPYSLAKRLDIVYSKCRRDNNLCLIWLGACTRNGYGKIGIGGRTLVLHRWIWEVYHGPIPGKLQVNHLCRVRNCIEVRHMELVTSGENTKKGALPFVNRLRALMQAVCKRGHEFTPINTGRTAKGGRYCKACKRENWITKEHREKLMKVTLWMTLKNGNRVYR